MNNGKFPPAEADCTWTKRLINDVHWHEISAAVGIFSLVGVISFESLINEFILIWS